MRADGQCARAPTIPAIATRGQHKAARVRLASCFRALGLSDPHFERLPLPPSL